MGIQIPWSLGERIGVMNPTLEKSILLALTFMVYHNSKSRLQELGGLDAVSFNLVQRIAAESSRTFLAHLM